MNLFPIIIGAIFVQNFVLMRFLGICPFIGVSKRTGPAFGMGAAVSFVMTTASLATWLAYQFLEAYGLEYLKIVVFIFVIASLVQLVEIVVKATSQKLYSALGIYLPLITTNCAVLGAAFLNISEGYNLLESIVHGISAGIGFTLALLLMSGIREHLDLGNVPKPFQGVPIAFITAAFMSLAFLGFSTLL
ncbi:MAG: electron transport complex protein RnfA [Candidatus Woesearchaeota archaeon]